MNASFQSLFGCNFMISLTITFCATCLFGFYVKFCFSSLRITFRLSLRWVNWLNKVIFALCWRKWEEFSMRKLFENFLILRFRLILRGNLQIHRNGLTMILLSHRLLFSLIQGNSGVLLLILLLRRRQYLVILRLWVNDNLLLSLYGYWWELFR